jgi:5-methylcytosine-specific restriction endonuclease McrA
LTHRQYEAKLQEETDSREHTDTMLAVPNKREYKFPAYVKDEIREKQKYRCATCGKHDSEVGTLQVHHVLPTYIAYNFFPQISLEALKSIENAVGLCSDCHSGTHDAIDELVTELEDTDTDTEFKHETIREQFGFISQALLGMRV